MAQKVFIPEIELQISGPKRSKTKAEVRYQFHCPVNGCVYDRNSERYFETRKYLKQHYQKVHQPKEFACEKCGKRFPTINVLNRHGKSCGLMFGCSCGVKYTSREALLTHARRYNHKLPKEYEPKKLLPVSASRKRVKSNSSSPSVIIITAIGDRNDTTVKDSVSVRSDSKPVPRFILPKSAPLSTVPLPTIAAMALSELSSSRDTVVGQQKIAVAVQTEVRCAKCNDATTSSDSKRNNETQTAQRGKRFRRRTAVTSKSKGTQTKSTAEKNVGVQTSAVIPSTQQPHPLGIFRPFYNSRSPWRIEELDVDVDGFSLPVSSGTQTSPRTTVPPHHSLFGPTAAQLLEQCYLGLDNLSPDIPQTASAGDLLEDVQTQTEYCHLDCLLLGVGDRNYPVVDDPAGIILSSSNIQTQTSDEDLESIPYDQLLSHMETQTSDVPFLFSDLTNFCDIQTQTGYEDNYAGNLVDTHTQTCGGVQDCPWKPNAETQTLLPLFGAGLIDSHTQTTSAMEVERIFH